MVTLSAAKGTLSGLVGVWSAGGWSAGGWAATIVTFNQGRHVVQRMLNLCFLQSNGIPCDVVRSNICQAPLGVGDPCTTVWLTWLLRLSVFEVSIECGCEHLRSVT